MKLNDEVDFRLPRINIVTAAMWVAGVIFFAILALNSFFVVSEGNRGVLTRNGGFVAVESPGLGFKVPFFDTVHQMEIRNMRMELTVNVYSADTQQYNALLSVNYDLNPAEVERIFKNEGIEYADRRLRPLVEATLKEIAGQFSAQRTIQERNIYGAQVLEAIRAAAAIYGINVTEVQVTNIDFTDQFENAIEDAMLAKAGVEQQRNILEQRRIQAETVVVDATAEANALRERAQGEADAAVMAAQAEAIRIQQIGEAEAESMRLRSEALSQNPQLTEYTRALAAMNWDGVLPQQFVPGSALPILDLTVPMLEQ